MSLLPLSLSLSVSPSATSRFSARPPEDADVVLMTAMERVRGRSSSSSGEKFPPVRASVVVLLEYFNWKTLLLASNELFHEVIHRPMMTY